MPPRPYLTIEQILAWADAFRLDVGRWPHRDDKAAGLTGETWAAIDGALKKGVRGLPGGTTLALLLREKRGRGHKGHRPPLTVAKILSWADAHRRRTGKWPTQTSGRVADTSGEKWNAIDAALRGGYRSLPKGSSIAGMLETHRGVRNPHNLSQLSVETVLGWADAQHAKSGKWPTRYSGGVFQMLGETWEGVDAALFRGTRGLPGGITLARLLADARGARHQDDLPPITLEQILAWADAHHARTGTWPTVRSGEIPGVPHTRWSVVEAALFSGNRGLPGGDSISRILAAHRGVRNVAALPPFDLGQVKAWVRAHHARTGAWPDRYSGPVADAPPETWGAVHSALSNGRRGLTKSSLPRLVAEVRG